MKLYAISDLHLRYRTNWHLLTQLPEFRDDWLIVAGDVCEHETLFARALKLLTERFAKVFWVPGNHELWSIPDANANIEGDSRYRCLVDICRHLGVVTPEDPFVLWPGPPEPHFIVPMFLLYDYSFRPGGMNVKQALDWAADSNIVCRDESYLRTTPHGDVAQWCAKRCDVTQARIERETNGHKTVLINHWPLREEMAVLPLIPRFKIWCGTRQTSDWHARFNASVVVFGHLHIRKTRHHDNVRFEEVSLGYPNQFDAERGITSYLREIFPGPSAQ